MGPSVFFPLHVKNAYGGVEVYIQSFLTSLLDALSGQPRDSSALPPA